MSYWLGRLPLCCCRSSQGFSARSCFELLNVLSRKIKCSLPFSVSYSLIAVTSTPGPSRLQSSPSSLRTVCRINFSRIFFRASGLNSSIHSFQPLLEAQDFHTFSSGFMLCSLFSFLALSFKG